MARLPAAAVTLAAAALALVRPPPAWQGSGAAAFAASSPPCCGRLSLRRPPRDSSATVEPRPCAPEPGRGGPGARRRRAASATAAALLAALLWGAGADRAAAKPKAVLAQDKNFKTVSVNAWVEESEGEPGLVLGLRGEPYWLLPGKSGGIRNFALRAECTHLGCIAPWNEVQQKFVCPCHGSQYDPDGTVLRGPAPHSLALAHVEVVDKGNVRLSAWTEEDFRDGAAPWWS